MELQTKPQPQTVHIADEDIIDAAICLLEGKLSLLIRKGYYPYIRELMTQDGKVVSYVRDYRNGDDFDFQEERDLTKEEIQLESTIEFLKNLKV